MHRKSKRRHRLRKLRDDVNRLAKYEERIKAHQADKKLGVGLSDAEIKDHKELTLLVLEDAEELADLEAAEVRRLAAKAQSEQKPETPKAVQDRATAIEEFHAEGAGALSEEAFEAWLNVPTEGGNVSKAAERRTAEGTEDALWALRAEHQAKRVTKRERFGEIWKKLKAMTPGGRSRIKLDKESEEERDIRVARTRALRAKGDSRTHEENGELEDLEITAASLDTDGLVRGARDSVAKGRERLVRLVHGGDGVLGDLSDEKLFEHRELEGLPEAKAQI